MQPIKYLSFFILILLVSCQSEPIQWRLIPQPNEMIFRSGVFDASKGISIISDNETLKSPISYFKNLLESQNIKVDKDASQQLKLNIKPLELKSEEAYHLEIKKKEIILSANSPKGIFYGLVSIWQGLKFSKNNSIPCAMIKDAPRFEYRGYMIDESRHFFGKEKIYQTLDLMALLKLNVFHWHLTDDPGWRIEIKGYPKLTTIGGIGTHSDSEKPAQFYTQQDIKNIVQYAAVRQIEIIPEIDMPGHARAANRAYPEFSGGGSKSHPNFTFNPGKEETYQYLTEILKEVTALFPTQIIHFGGDEVHFGNEKWNHDKYVQKLMKQENLKDLKEVEFYFSHRMADSIKALGNKVAGWDEVVTAGLDKKNTLVYWWRHDKINVLQESLDKGYQVILCPRRPLYFDFLQEDFHKNGRTWDGICTLEDVYNYPDSNHDFSKTELDLVKGIQANMWTEKFDTDQWIDFMNFPRLFALSEAAWTGESNKNYVDFKKQVSKFNKYLDDLNIYYYNEEDTNRKEPKITAIKK